MPDAVIVDLDGTLAHRVGRGRSDYGEALLTDEADAEVLADVKRQQRAGAAVIILTARPWQCEALTVEWLASVGLDPDYIYMRDETDASGTVSYKEELYEAFLRDRWTVIAVYEDHPKLVALWRRLGLECVDVGAT